MIIGPTATGADASALLAEIAAQLKTFKGSAESLIKIVQDEFTRAQIPLSESSKVPVTSLLMFNRPLQIRCVIVYNSSAVNTSYAQLHNAAFPVNEGATADIIIPLPPKTTETMDWPFRGGPFFSNGLFVAGSSTDTKKTAITSPDLVIFATFDRI